MPARGGIVPFIFRHVTPSVSFAEICVCLPFCDNVSRHNHNYDFAIRGGKLYANSIHSRRFRIHATAAFVGVELEKGTEWTVTEAMKDPAFAVKWPVKISRLT